MTREILASNENRSLREKASAKLVVNLLHRADFSAEDCGDIWYALEVNNLSGVKNRRLAVEEMDLLEEEMSNSDRLTKLLSPELREKTWIYLLEQRGLLLNRPPTYPERLLAAPSEILSTVTSLRIPVPELPTSGKVLVGLNIVCATTWGVNSYLSYLSGSQEEVVFKGAVAAMWVGIGALNTLANRKRK